MADPQRDVLTGFYTRETLFSYIESLVSASQGEAKPFSLAIIDLDHFKKFNDTYGHPFGDEILRYTTSTLRLTIYESQCRFFRYGGDEFIGVFPGQAPKDVLHLMRQAHYNLYRRPFLFENKFYKITLSCGLAGFPADAMTTDELIKRADEALYFAKRSGRNQSVVFDKISYLKAKKLGKIISLICFIAVLLFVGYKYLYKKVIQPQVGQIKGIKLVTRPQSFDTVILKNGQVFEGNIVAETKSRLILDLYFEKGGKGRMTFKKDEIEEVKRSDRPANKTKR